MTWRRVAPFFARRIQLAIFIIAIGFGLDYLFTPDGSSVALTTIEQTAFPLWVWGATIMVCGIAGFVVEWRILGNDHSILMTEKRWHWGWVSNTAHIVLFALFVVLAASTIFDVIDRGADTGQWYGWRTTIMWGGFAYANWLFIQRPGDRL